MWNNFFFFFFFRDYLSLMHACIHGQLAAVKILVDNGAVFDDYDLGGSSAIHYAVDSCNCELIEWVCKSGANINCQDKIAGWSPLMRCGEFCVYNLIIFFFLFQTHWEAHMHMCLCLHICRVSGLCTQLYLLYPARHLYVLSATKDAHQVLGCTQVKMMTIIIILSAKP